MLNFRCGCVRVFLIIGVLLVASASHAEDDPEALIRQGVELRRLGNDVTAHGYFERAYERSHTPRSAAQLGLSDLALSKWLPAQQHLSEALDAPDPWVESHKTALEKARSSARTHLGRVVVNGAPANATFTTGDGATASLPKDGLVWVNPGSVEIRVQAPGFRSATSTVSVGVGGRASTDAVLARIEAAPVVSTPPQNGQRGREAAAQPPRPVSGAARGATVGISQIPANEPKPAPIEQGRGLRIASITVGTVGVGAIVAGLILRNVATTKMNAITADGKAMRPYNPANGNYREYEQLGVGSIIGGGVALSAGIVGFLLGHGRSSGESTVSFEPGPGQAGINVIGAF